MPLQHAGIVIEGIVDRDNQPRQDLTLFNTIKLTALLKGVSRPQAKVLVEGFKRRCPIFGTVSAGAQQTIVDYDVE
jgi:hypothetical protein